MRFPLLVSLLVSAVVGVAARDAAACAPACEPAYVSGPSVPASIPALLFSYVDPNGVELRGRDGVVAGQPVPFDFFGLHGFSPASDFAPGTYVVRASSACGIPYEQTLTITEPAPWPDATGTLTVASAERSELSVRSTRGSCVENVDAGIVTLELTVAPTLAPYQDAVVYETRVDDRSWVHTLPGMGRTTDPMNTRNLLRLHAACDVAAANALSADVGLAEGAHDVSVHAVLPGGATIPAATLRGLIVSCDDRNGTLDEPQPDAGSSSSSSGGSSSGGSSSGGSSSGGSSSGGRDGRTTYVDVNEGEGCGCSATRGPDVAGFGLFALMALAWRRPRRGLAPR